MKNSIKYIQMYRPVILTGLDLALQDKEKHRKGDSIFQPEVSEQYLTSSACLYPRGYQVSVQEMYGFRGYEYLGSRIPAIMALDGSYPIIVRGKTGAYMLAKQLAKYLSDEEFDGSKAQCLFVRHCGLLKPVLVANVKILETVKSFMGSVDRQNAFVICDYDLQIKDRLKMVA